MNERIVADSGPAEAGSALTLVGLSEIARQLAETHGIDELLQLAVELAVRHLDGCDGGSVMLVCRGGTITTPASTSPTATAIDRAQSEADEGPCLESLREHHTVVIEDLADEQRWPHYVEAALAAGARSTLSVRLFLLEDSMGALNLYSRSPSAFGEASVILGQVLASHAAVALKAAITEAGLTAALATRDLIGQAKGVIMAGERCTAERAFTRLRDVSQRCNRPLRDVAQDVVTLGTLPE